MIFAELHGKLGTNYALAHDRAEDLLTSFTFQLLRYIPLGDGLLPMLRRAQLVEFERTAAEPFECIDVQLWPRLSSICCPDVLVTGLKDGRVSSAILVEVKLYSGKSGRGTGAQVEAEEAFDAPDKQFEPDQLARYWVELARKFPDATRAIIYLTSHLTAPEAELRESLARAPDMRLRWLSWYDVWEIVHAKSNQYLPAKDLADLLSYRGFSTFMGFRSRGTGVDFPSSAHFFDANKWFTTPRIDLPHRPHFWEHS
jgi:hypothetical protein